MGEYDFIFDLATRSFVDLATALGPVAAAGWGSASVFAQRVGTGVCRHGEGAECANAQTVP